MKKIVDIAAHRPKGNRKKGARISQAPKMKELAGTYESMTKEEQYRTLRYLNEALEK